MACFKFDTFARVRERKYYSLLGKSFGLWAGVDGFQQVHLKAMETLIQFKSKLSFVCLIVLLHVVQMRMHQNAVHESIFSHFFLLTSKISKKEISLWANGKISNLLLGGLSFGHLAFVLRCAFKDGSNF